MLKIIIVAIKEGYSCPLKPLEKNEPALSNRNLGQHHIYVEITRSSFLMPI